MTKHTSPQMMIGVVLTGHGGFEKLEYRLDLPVPALKENEVLIKVGACAVNNTDINTRIGWYSKNVSGDTNAGGTSGFAEVDNNDASWSGTPLQFPRIQGADISGTIVGLGEGVDSARLNERVLIRSLQQIPDNKEGYGCITIGSECDGGLAQYVKTLATESYTIESSFSDVELASFPCAYSTAENMIDRAGVKEGETVIITGASGGVGSAAVQLVKRRKAKVIAICSREKTADLLELGADKIIARGENIVEHLGQMSVDVAIDVVAGNQWPELLTVLKRGGRYAVSGAIAGPIVELDVRTLYLKDLSFYGCTYQPRHVFENLVKYIEHGELRPIVSQTYPLKNIREAQEDFLAKKFVGKLVLIPPQ